MSWLSQLIQRIFFSLMNCIHLVSIHHHHLPFFFSLMCISSPSGHTNTHSPTRWPEWLLVRQALPDLCSVSRGQAGPPQRKCTWQSQHPFPCQWAGALFLSSPPHPSFQLHITTESSTTNRMGYCTVWKDGFQTVTWEITDCTANPCPPPPLPSNSRILETPKQSKVSL